MKKSLQAWNEQMFLTDGGLETSLIFLQGLSLRYFAAFELLSSEDGRRALEKYYLPYIKLAEQNKTGFILETPTWRANPDWAYKMGYTHEDLMGINHDAVSFVKGLIDKRAAYPAPVIISGNMGPRGDGYKVENRMSAMEARAYHYAQIQAFVNAGVDIVTVLTMNYVEEAIGIAEAAKSLQVPCVISYTVETNGELPDGTSLKAAIEKTEEETGEYPLHYMINCAHPKHFENVLHGDGKWLERIKGIRANASTMSHAELDESETLDAGDKNLLANGYAELNKMLPNLNVIGGCCGTDHTHITEIYKKLSNEKTEIK